jgi:hypothetical protein
LHEVVVIRLAPTENAKQRVVHDAEQAIVEQSRNAVLAALDSFEDLLVRRRLNAFAPSWDEAERGSAGGGAGNHDRFLRI